MKIGNTENHILLFLYDHRDEHTEKEIRKAIASSYSLHTALKSLAKKGLIVRKKMLDDDQYVFCHYISDKGKALIDNRIGNQGYFRMEKKKDEREEDIEDLLSCYSLNRNDAEKVIDFLKERNIPSYTIMSIYTPKDSDKIYISLDGIEHNIEIKK